MKRSKGRGLLRICGLISVLLHDAVLFYLFSLGVYLFEHIRLSFPEQIGQYLVGYMRQLVRILNLGAFPVEINEPVSGIFLLMLALMLICGIAAGVWAIVGKASLLTLFDSILLLYLDVVWLVLTGLRDMTGGGADIVNHLFQMPYLAGFFFAGFCLIYFIAVLRRFVLLNSYWRKYAEEADLASTMSRLKSRQTAIGTNDEQNTRVATRGSWIKETKEEVQAPREEADIRRKRQWRRRLALCSVLAVIVAGAAVYMGIVSYQKSQQHREMITSRAAQALDITPTLDISQPSRLSRMDIVGYWYCVRMETAEETIEIDDETGSLTLGLMEDHQLYLQILQGSVWKRNQPLTFMTGEWLYLDSSSMVLDFAGMEISSYLVNGSLVLQDGDSTYYMEKEPDFSPSIVQQNMANTQLSVGTWISENKNSAIAKITFREDGTWKSGKTEGIYIPEYGDRITAIDKDKEYYFDVANDKLEYYFICGQDSYQREEEDGSGETVSDEDSEEEESASEMEQETALEEAEMTGGAE